MDELEAGMDALEAGLQKILRHMPEKYRKKIANGAYSQPLSTEEFTRLEVERAKRLAAAENTRVGNLDKFTGYDCPKCLNRGTFSVVVEDGPFAGETRSVICPCVTKRRSIRLMKQSGLSEMAARYTLQNWQCREKWQENLRNAAAEYAQRREGWFYIGGRPGTGKTHICTALCALLIEQGLETRYMLWRDVSARAKAVVNDAEAYQEIVGPLKKTPLLYIDDFFKMGKTRDRSGQRVKAEPTVGDVNLAFEIINARYNDSKLLTIFSSEMSIPDILDIDEGIGSRIAQRTHGRNFDLSDKQNWRLMNAGN